MATRAEESVAHVRRPLEGIYGVSLLTAILALVPYILVTSAYTLFRKQVAGDIGAGPIGLEIINGLSTAGYAFGALLGGDLINRLKQRHLFLACEGFFILAAFSLPSRIVGRTFALVELVRSVADFILAPVMLGIARVVSGAMHPGAAGLRYSIWLTLGVAAALTLGGVALYLLGGAGLPRPDLVAWIEHNRPAIGSPPLAQKLRES